MTKGKMIQGWLAYIVNDDTPDAKTFVHVCATSTPSRCYACPIYNKERALCILGNYLSEYRNQQGIKTISTHRRLLVGKHLYDIEGCYLEKPDND